MLNERDRTDTGHNRGRREGPPASSAATPLLHASDETPGANDHFQPRVGDSQSSPRCRDEAMNEALTIRYQEFEPKSIPEHELRGFVDVVTELLGTQQANVLTEIWLDELAS